MLVGIDKTIRRMVSYTLSDFHNISTKGFRVVLPNSTVALINSLSAHVGAPNYIKTPVFNKKDMTQVDPDKKRRRDRNMRRGGGGDAGTWNTDKYKNGLDGGNQHLCDNAMDFEGETHNNIVFKSPSTMKKELSLIDTYIQKMRVLLNKVTLNGDIDLITPLTSTIDEMLETDITAEEVDKVAEKLTNIMMTNGFYSNDYVRIYAIIYKKYGFIRDLFAVQHTKYINSYNDILDINPDEDYDTFCIVNKQNDERRAKTLFYTKLYTKYNIVSTEQMMTLIQHLIHTLYIHIDSIEHMCQNDELIENICTLIIKTNTDLMKQCITTQIADQDENITIGEFINKIYKSKPKQHGGISTKSLFKFMETIETNQKSKIVT